MRKDYFPNKKSGFTLIEMLIFIFIFVIVSLTFYQIMSTGIQIALESKNRLGALALANEKMEIVRNLKYEDVGTVGGVPNGTLPETETVSASGHQYRVDIFVQYVDDVFDGTAAGNTDTAANDYKRVKITVSWIGVAGKTKDVSVVSRFVPPGLEVGAGGGVLSVNIINSAGAGVSQSQVHIVNNDISPAVNVTQNTDNGGNLIFVGAQQSIYNYVITVSKTGYETINTIDPGSVAYSPIDVHASVVEGLLNTKSIVIDLLSSLTIKASNYANSPISDLGFHLEGGRILGTNNATVPAETIYILDANETTDVDGERTINNQSPGQFFLTNIGTISGSTLVGVSPITGFEATPLIYKFSLLPGTNKTVEIKFAEDGQPGLLVKVMNNAGDVRIDGAEVKLTSAGGYDETISATSFDGVAFFPNDNDPLINGEYTLGVTVPGFEPYSETIEVDNLTIQEVKLIAS